MILGLRIWTLCAAMGAVALGGCKDDPPPSLFSRPCYELQGDLSCQSMFENRPYCNICVSVNQGCVLGVPASGCRPQVGTTNLDGGESTTTSEVLTSSSDSGSVSESSGTTSGEPTCDAEGEFDPTCDERDPTRPFCIDAVCVGCDAAGGDGFCDERDALTPACDPLAGVCVGCGEADHASCGGARPTCDVTGACVMCAAHSDCPQTACHLSAADPRQGYCFEPDEVRWIDNEAPCPGVGTNEEPACSLQAISSEFVAGDRRVLRIAGGTPYLDRGVFAGEMTIAIIGDEGPEIRGIPGQQAAALIFNDGVTAYVDGVDLSGNSLTHGILCNSSNVTLDRSSVRNNDGWGIFSFEPCTLDVQRTVIASNEDGGLRVPGGDLSLINSVVALNGIGGNSTGLELVDVNIDIVYSTIVGNDGAASDSLQCTNVAGTLRNSIVAGHDGLSIELNCFPLVMQNNALDTANFVGASNVQIEPYNSIYFNSPDNGDFTLSAPPLTPFGNVARWVEGDPSHDADGTPRPMDGSLGYAGVDEP